MNASPEPDQVEAPRGRRWRLLANRRMVWRQTMRLFGLGFLLVLVAVRYWDPAPVEVLRLKTLDVYQQIKPREPTPQPVVIVDIDDRSLKTIGQWPWPRTQLAELVRKLFDAGAATVGFDIVFAEPDRLTPSRVASGISGLSPDAKAALENAPDNDAVFAATLKQYPTVLGRFLRTRDEGGSAAGISSVSIAVKGEDPKPFLPAFDGVLANLPELEAAAQGVGMLVQTNEHDSVVRRVPTLLRVGDTVQAAFTLEMLRVATGQRTYLAKSDHAGLAALVIAGNEIPTDHAGRVWVHYRKSLPSLYVSAADVLSGKVGAERFQGHLVLVGTSAVGLRDLRATPLNPVLPGVEVHAQLLETILSGSMLERPAFAVEVEVFALLLMGGLIILALPRIGAWWTLTLEITLVILTVAGVWWLFSSYRILVDLSYPLMASFAMFVMLSFMNYVREQADRRQIREAFSRYLSPDVVNRLSDNPDQLRLGGEMRDMTLLFSDVQGFTGIAENYDAAGLTRLINDILTPITARVLETGGTVDKYMGDALMAFWNAPLDDADHAVHACRSALAVRAEIAPLNEKLQRQAAEDGRSFVPVNVGVGLNTGECCVGNMGSDQRFDYSVLGDAVNLASRLEGQTRTYGVGIVSGEETRTLAGKLAFLELDLITVKGKTIPERIFALLGDESMKSTENFRRLEEIHAGMLAAYRAQDWSTAETAIEKARQASSEAGLDLSVLYELFSQRIVGFRADPPATEWDGVYVAATKG